MRIEGPGNLPVEIKQQFLIDSGKPTRFGEVILEAENPEKCRGQIGWLEWSNETGSRPGVTTARLMIVGAKFGILTAKAYRTPRLKIGTELFLFQSNRLRELGYQDICVLHVTEGSLQFYIQAIEKLKETVQLSNPTIGVKSEEFYLSDQNTRDDHSLRIMFSPKTPILPDTEPVGSILGPDLPSP